MRSIPWTPEEDAVLLDLAKNNMFASEIGKRMGRSKASVEGRLRALNCGTISWTKDRVALLTEMWAANDSLEDIAAACGSTIAAIQNKVGKLGFAPRPVVPAADLTLGKCPACLIHMEFADNCPVSKCPFFKGYSEPYEQTIAGVSAGWAANG